jgi:hypothetical protein
MESIISRNLPDFAGILRDLGGDVKKKHPCKISIF